MFSLLFHKEEMKRFFKDNEEIQRKIKNGEIRSSYIELDYEKEQARYYLLDDLPESKEEIRNNHEVRITDYDKVLDWMQK